MFKSIVIDWTYILRSVWGWVCSRDVRENVAKDLLTQWACLVCRRTENRRRRHVLEWGTRLGSVLVLCNLFFVALNFVFNIHGTLWSVYNVNDSVKYRYSSLYLLCCQNIKKHCISLIYDNLLWNYFLDHVLSL